MGRVFPSTSGGGDPIDSVAPFNKTEDLPEFSDGTTWLKTGVIETDVDSYPDANITIDVSTGEYTGQSLSSSESTTTRDISLSTDGTKAYFLNGSGVVYQYSLSTAFDISTGTYDSKSVSIVSQDNTMRGIAFSYDGSRMYAIGQVSDFIYQYNLSTNWDVSTAVYAVKVVSVGSQDASPLGMVITDDGETIYMVGQQNDRVYQYSLPTPFELSGVTHVGQLSVGTQSTAPSGVGISADGTKVLVICESNDEVFEYELSTPFLVSTGSYSSNSFSVSSELSATQGMHYRQDSDVYAVSMANTIYQYDTFKHVGISTESTDTDTGLPIYTRIK